MLDHVGIPVTDYGRSKRFYGAALAPLGLGLVMELGEAGGFGPPGKPGFWIGEEEGKIEEGTHVAFHAKDRASADAFYRAAMAAGGRDNGAPGLRPASYPTYYGAFVLDPDGHNGEAVCHKPA